MAERDDQPEVPERTAGLLLENRPSTTDETLTEYSLPGHQYNDQLQKAVTARNFDVVNDILVRLETECREWTPVIPLPDKPVNEQHLHFWLLDVGELMFESAFPHTRLLALKALEAVYPHLERLPYHYAPNWCSIRSQICTTYPEALVYQRTEREQYWGRIWRVLLRILDQEMCNGAVIINVYLGIVEAGFRSPEITMREQAFDCWFALVKLFTKHNEISQPKRLRLICIPLKSSKSRTLSLALKKFDIWWYLMNALQSHLENNLETVFEPFAYFCFGPSFKTPLCYYLEEQYRECTVPGKIYVVIKQFSVLAMLFMLGEVPLEAKSLQMDYHTGRWMNFQKPTVQPLISPAVFALRGKLIVYMCAECTVLFSQLPQTNCLDLNRLLWSTLLERIVSDKALPKNDFILWIKEVLLAMVALINTQQAGFSRLPKILYSTTLQVVRSDLLTVTVGQDTPEQLVLNYKNIMAVILDEGFPFTERRANLLVNGIFDLQRYVDQNAYWDALQKTIQFLCDLQQTQEIREEVQLYVTKIYNLLADLLVTQIQPDRKTFEDALPVMLSYLLFPLEYDSLLVVDQVQKQWCQVFEKVISVGPKSLQCACALSEMIKAMTVAKFTCNLGVVIKFFIFVLRSIEGDFDGANAPIKTLELYKDLVRRAVVYRTNPEELSDMMFGFKMLLERMSDSALLVVILPLKNIINEMLGCELDPPLVTIKATMKVLADKLASEKMALAVRSQPKEVKWNCKMIIRTLLEVQVEPPIDNWRDGWPIDALQKCMDICDKDKVSEGKSKKKAKDEFVVIEKVWKFTPDKLTDHQRERMMEKRCDIPAMYNDMSQSQDSFVIKPWTPSKHVQPVVEDYPVDVGEEMARSVDDVPGTTNKDEGGTKQQTTEKENNNGNIQPPEIVENVAEGSTVKKVGGKRKTVYELEHLKIDTVEGKNLEGKSMGRTRRSVVLESRSSRRKSMDPQKRPESDKKKRRNRQKNSDSSNTPDQPTQETGRQQSSSSRKLLNFEHVVDQKETTGESSSAPLSPKSPTKIAAVANELTEEVIESSQTVSQSIIGRKMSFRKSRSNSDEQLIRPLINGTLSVSGENVQKPEKLGTEKSKSTVALIEEMETTDNNKEVRPDDPDVVKEANPECRTLRKATRSSSPVPKGNLDSSESESKRINRPNSLTEVTKLEKRVTRSVSPAHKVVLDTAEKSPNKVFKPSSPVKGEQEAVEKNTRTETRSSSPVKGEQEAVEKNPRTVTRSSSPVQGEDREAEEKSPREVIRSSSPVQREEQEPEEQSPRKVKRSSSPVQREEQEPEEKSPRKVTRSSSPVQTEEQETKEQSPRKVKRSSSPVQREEQEAEEQNPKKVTRSSSPVQTEEQEAVDKSPKKVTRSSSAVSKEEKEAVEKNTKRITRSSSPVMAEQVPEEQSPRKVTRSSNPAQMVELTATERSPKKVMHSTNPGEKQGLVVAPKTVERSPKKDAVCEDSTSPKKVTRSSGVVKDLKDTELSDAPKNPKKCPRTVSPVPMVIEADEPSSPQNLSPMRNLDEEMEPFNKSLNRSLMSSPETADCEERTSDFMNNTLNISPIAEEKNRAAAAPSAVVAEATTGKASERRTRKAEIVQPSPITRRSRASPPGPLPAINNLKMRTAPASPRSPTANRIVLRGRGAQLINMIRSQQTESSPKQNLNPQSASTPKTSSSSSGIMMRKQAPTPSSELPSSSTAMPVITPVAVALTLLTPADAPDYIKPPTDKEPGKDYLIFSKVLPSPQASPAASILKRKYNQDDSGDDNDYSACKRKRVSFHDPPVSVTKKYVLQEEEYRVPMSTRSLQLGSMSPSVNLKFKLQRKSKTDSIVELQNFTQATTAADDQQPPDSKDGEANFTTMDDDGVMEITSSPDLLEDGEIPNDTSVSMAPLQVSAVAGEEDVVILSVDEASPRAPTGQDNEAAEENKTEASLTCSAPKIAAVTEEQQTSEEPRTAAVTESGLRFQSEDDVLAHVIQRYTLDAMFERYIEAGKTIEQHKSVRSIAKELSAMMTKDAKTRFSVLDELSERHSAEFLDHAVQENSSAMVCQRLSVSTMTDYIFQSLRKHATASAAAVTSEEREECHKVLVTMFENLQSMPSGDGTGTADLSQMRDQFLRDLLMRKDHAEVMALLQDYFRANSNTTT